MTGFFTLGTFPLALRGDASLHFSGVFGVFGVLRILAGKREHWKTWWASERLSRFVQDFEAEVDIDSETDRG